MNTWGNEEVEDFNVEKFKEMDEVITRIGSWNLAYQTHPLYHQLFIFIFI